MLTLPPNIRINMGTQQPSGVVAHCNYPLCQWVWVWEPITEAGVSEDDIMAITEAHAGTHPAPEPTDQ